MALVSPQALRSNHATDVDGRMLVAGVGTEASASAAVSNVASSASSVTLKAANTSRRGLLIFNDSTQVLYVKYGATASTSSYTVQIAAGGYWEMPQPPYTGVVDGIWAASNGNARVTELS